MKTKEKNQWYAKILINFGYDLTQNWFNYKQEYLETIDKLAEAMNIKGSEGRCPGRTLWDRAQKGRPF